MLRKMCINHLLHIFVSRSLVAEVVYLIEASSKFMQYPYLCYMLDFRFALINNQLYQGASEEISGMKWVK